MPARHFTRGVGDGLLLSIGACPATFGPGTLVAICRHTATPDTFRTIVAVGSSDGNAYMLHSAQSGTDAMGYWNGTADVTSTITFGTADGWCLVAVTKASGTNAPRFHKIRLDGGAAPSHVDSGSTVGDVTSVGTNSRIACYLSSIGSVNEKFDGDFLCAAVYNVVLTDAQLETMAWSLKAWWARQPSALWMLDQETTGQIIRDLTGGGANPITTQTSGVSTSVNGFSYGQDVLIYDTATLVIQILRPSTDSVDGNWTSDSGGTALAAAIDETSPSDADYIRSELVPSNSGCRIKLGTASTPQSGARTISWRIGKDTTGGDTINMKIQLRQGGGNTLGAGTLVDEFTRNAVDAATTYDETVTGTITDYADLYVEFYANP